MMMMTMIDHPFQSHFFFIIITLLLKFISICFVMWIIILPPNNNFIYQMGGCEYYLIGFECDS